MSDVYISEVLKPDVRSIQAAITAGCQAVPAATRLLAGCASALVKPNLMGTFNHEIATTNPLVVEAVIAFLQDQGVAEIALGEGCSGGASAQEVFDITGLTEMAGRRGIRTIDLEQTEHVEVPTRSRLLLDSVKVAREALGADLLVNVPTLKTHVSTQISVAMKNLKGAIPWTEKRRFHRQGLFESIVDLSSAFPRQLIVVDGTRAMEGMGPMVGELLPLDRILVGTDALAIDLVAARVMGFDPEEVPTVRLAIEAGLGCAEPAVVGTSIASVKEALGRPFERPVPGHILEPAFGTVVFGEKVCSACQGDMHALFTHGGSVFTWLPSEKLIHFYAGDVAAVEPSEPGIAVAWGLCAVRESRRAGLEDGPRCVFVHGCPPDPVTSFEALGRLQAHFE